MTAEITWTVKSFNELSPFELYEITKLRLEVFVVEQNCPYQDADGKDQYSFHVSGHQDIQGKKTLVAYARVVAPGISYKEPSIGRVVTSPLVRRTGLGAKLMEKAISVCEEKFGKGPIRIGAQKYLKKYYESFGFKDLDKEYLEDGIPHLIMLRNQ